MVLFFGDSSHSLPIPQYFATQGSIGCGPVRKIRETSRFRHGLRTTSKAIPERLIPQIHVRLAFSDRCTLVHDFKLSWIEFEALRSSKIFSRLKLFKSFGYEVVRLFSSFFLRGGFALQNLRSPCLWPEFVHQRDSLEYFITVVLSRFRALLLRLWQRRGRVLNKESRLETGRVFFSLFRVISSFICYTRLTET